MPTVDVLGSTIYYEESGSGAPVVLLHGNPGSSYLWRNVRPGLSRCRVLTPDLIGMGRSGKPDLSYSFADHARYLDAWFDSLDLDGVVLVGHDWGGALAFDWASRHPERVRGVAFLEAIVKPIARSELAPPALRRSEMVLDPANEEKLLGDDTLIRMAFTGGGVRTPVSDDDLQHYLAPYSTPESRRPVLAWARQIPLDGEPAELVTRVEAFDAWLAAATTVPKLLMTFEGAVLIDKGMVDWCAEHIAALEIVGCGPAGHHAPEDRPKEIAEAISDWLDRHALH